MRTIGIIGLGHTGCLLANLLLARGDVDELVLIDQDIKRVRALSCDLTDAMAAYQPVIIQQNYSALDHADMIICAAGDAHLLRVKRFGELASNLSMVKELAPRIKQTGFNGVFLNLSNPNEATTARWQKELGLPAKQVIGSGTIVDTQRARMAVANQAQLNPAAVDGFIIGQHDGRLVFPWSSWHVNGRPMGHSINGHRLDKHQLEINSQESNWVTMAGLGYDATAICFAALRVMRAVFTDSGQPLPVAVYHPQFQTYLSYPVTIGRQGTSIFNLLNLLPVEQEQLSVAAQAIADQEQQ